MALSKGMTALRAALGAVGGGLEGYAQFQEMTRKREFEREKEKAAAARQAMLDAAALRGEERQAAAAGMIPATQYTGLSPFDMPGATPRQPLLRQTIGGREMVLPEAPKIAEHRAGMVKEISERRKKSTALEASLDAGEQAGFDRNKLRAVLTAPASVQGVMAARAFPAPERTRGAGAGAAKGPSAEDLLRAEAQWNSLTNIPDAQLKPEEVQFRNTMVRTFDKLRASPSGKGAPALNLIFQAVSAAEAQNKRLTAPPKTEDDKGDLANRVIEQVRAGRTGSAAGRPAAAPAATLPEAAPASQSAPAGADPERYRTDANYRRWVDSQLRG